MHVAFIHHYSLTQNRGGERILQSMARELEKRGHNVSIYAVPFRRAKDRTFKPEGYNYHETVSGRIECDIAYYFYVPLLDKLFRTKAPRIAGIHNFTMWPRFSLEHVKTPELVYRIGIFASAVIVYNKLNKGSDIVKHFDAVHVPNFIAPARFKIPVYCIPNWYDDEVFKPSYQKNDIFTILYVGSEAWTKGLDIFLKIHEILSKRFKDIIFIIVGLKKKIKGKNIYVYPFINSRKKLSKIYSSSHLTVYPSRADIFGITLIESMACGTPVLTSDLPSHRCIVPKFSLCQSLSDYVCKTIKIYEAFKDANGSYELYVKDALRLSANFSKRRIFPLFENMLREVCMKI